MLTNHYGNSQKVIKDKTVKFLISSVIYDDNKGFGHFSFHDVPRDCIVHYGTEQSKEDYEYLKAIHFKDDEDCMFLSTVAELSEDEIDEYVETGKFTIDKDTRSSIERISPKDTSGVLARLL